MAYGENATTSALHATAHLGAHADAPSHYHRNGATIDQCSLYHYLGSCQVVSVDVSLNTPVTLKHLKVDIVEPRVLFHTGTFPNPNCFKTDFASLSTELVHALHVRGVITIGIDTPSVDLYSESDLPVHQAFYQNQMAILEGLVLDSVPDGIYELIALPLRLVGFDASPVRAILRSDGRGKEQDPISRHARVPLRPIRRPLSPIK